MNFKRFLNFFKNLFKGSSKIPTPRELNKFSRNYKKTPAQQASFDLAKSNQRISLYQQTAKKYNTTPEIIQSLIGKTRKNISLKSFEAKIKNIGQVQVNRKVREIINKLPEAEFIKDELGVITAKKIQDNKQIFGARIQQYIYDSGIWEIAWGQIGSSKLARSRARASGELEKLAQEARNNLKYSS